MMKKYSILNIIFILLILIIITILTILPTGFNINASPNSLRTVGKILEVDNSGIQNTGGLINIGEQICRVEILKGKFKGKEIQASNNLSGRLEFDKLFEKGDKALTVVEFNGDNIRDVTLIDHYRINIEILLFFIFAVFLIIFARWIGVKALISFVLTVLSIWKVMVPLVLKGYNPIIISMILVVFLTIVVILLVGGFNKKSLAAILGSLSGTILTCILAFTFAKYFKIHGAILPFAEPLLYAGYAHLKLTDIFISVVFIASAGALMDLAMDISASVNELVIKKPDISAKEAINSGMNVGKAVVGTMTTTLLFAYTGGYLALLMYFMAQGTPVIDILNLRYVSKEIMQTIIGSFGLVTVSPFTAIISGVLFTKKADNKHTIST